MNAQVTPADRTAAELKVIAGVLTAPDYIGKFKNFLPENMRPERFIECALNYLAQHTRILAANRESLYLAIQDAAQDGLYVDGKEAAINAYKKKVGDNKWDSFAEYIPMVDGIAKKLGQAGIVIDTQLVHELDDFECEMGDNPKITHKLPKLGIPRGPIVGAYAIVHLPNGLVRREVMDREALDNIRNMTQSKNKAGEIVGPWAEHPGEMCRKTVFKRAQKRLPNLDPELERLLKRGEEPIEGTAHEVDPEETIAQAAPTGRPRALAGLATTTETPAPTKTAPEPARSDNGFSDDDDDLL